MAEETQQVAYVKCPWCGGAKKIPDQRGLPMNCLHCGGAGEVAEKRL